MSKAGDRELIRKERRRIVLGLDDDAAAERRYARMDELVGDELRAMRCAFQSLDRACGTNRWKAAAGPRITFRLVGGKLVRETDNNDGERKEVAMKGGLGRPSSSTAAARSEDELCSALGSARF